MDNNLLFPGVLLRETPVVHIITQWGAKQGEAINNTIKEKSNDKYDNIFDFAADLMHPNAFDSVGAILNTEKEIAESLMNNDNE